MLKIIESMNQLQFGKLMAVYEESNLANGLLHYPKEERSVQLLWAEQDFLTYLEEEFFQIDDAFYAVWEEGGEYVSALRIEPFLDGVLLAGLETHPKHRRKGYASVLIHNTLTYLRSKTDCVYSHVDKRNIASLRTHYACGFACVSDSARYLDGAVRDQSVTLKYTLSNR